MSSSIQEAFAKAMTQTQAHFSPIPDEWDDEGNAAKIEYTTKEQTTMQTERPYFTVTNNVTRVTFDYVLNNPGKKRVEVSNALEQQGFKKSSTTSILGQLVKQGLVTEDGYGKLAAATSEYRPLKGSAKMKKKEAKAKTKAAVQSVANTSVQSDFSAEKIVERLTPKQAKAVYDYLKELFA